MTNQLVNEVPLAPRSFHYDDHPDKETNPIEETPKTQPAAVASSKRPRLPKQRPSGVKEQTPAPSSSPLETTNTTTNTTTTVASTANTTTVNPRKPPTPDRMRQPEVEKPDVGAAIQGEEMPVRGVVDAAGASTLAMFSAVGPDASPPSSSDVRLVSCGNCGRRFAEDRVEKHEKACAGQKERKKYDTKKHRVQGKDHASYALNAKYQKEEVMFFFPFFFFSFFFLLFAFCYLAILL